MGIPQVPISLSWQLYFQTGSAVNEPRRGMPQFFCYVPLARLFLFCHKKNLL
ncbi:hypothetical protein SAMN05421882_106115 [Nitrosomonas communis]|uniref:Uncharacterized protein n=1 Tax=Nitrosomonas communis TaxID=44574 RepID=A0A1H2YZ64_9PROT|nr:hypothetical protein SAMN05421882_106115 [Nitrosomonas communis]